MIESELLVDPYARGAVRQTRLDTILPGCIIRRPLTHNVADSHCWMLSGRQDNLPHL